jgi:RNA-binding protein
MTDLSPQERKELKAQAHHLDPLVIIGDKGLTPSVIAEIDRALRAHELIKVRDMADDRHGRGDTMAQICRDANAQAVQIIGKQLVIYRKRTLEESQAITQQVAARKERLAVKRRAAEAAIVREARAQREASGNTGYGARADVRRTAAPFGKPSTTPTGRPSLRGTGARPIGRPSGPGIRPARTAARDAALAGESSSYDSRPPRSPSRNADSFSAPRQGSGFGDASGSRDSFSARNSGGAGAGNRGASFRDPSARSTGARNTGSRDFSSRDSGTRPPVTRDSFSAKRAPRSFEDPTNIPAPRPSTRAPRPTFDSAPPPRNFRDSAPPTRSPARQVTTTTPARVSKLGLGAGLGSGGRQAVKKGDDYSDSGDPRGVGGTAPRPPRKPR